MHIWWISKHKWLSKINLNWNKWYKIYTNIEYSFRFLSILLLLKLLDCDFSIIIHPQDNQFDFLISQRVRKFSADKNQTNLSYKIKFDSSIVVGKRSMLPSCVCLGSILKWWFQHYKLIYEVIYFVLTRVCIFTNA